MVTPLFRHDPDLALRVLTTGMPDKAYQMLRPLVRIFPAFYRLRHRISDAKLAIDRATVNAALDRIEQERQGRAYLVGDGSRSRTRGCGGMLSPFLRHRDPVPAARRAAAVSAGLPRHAATASGHSVGIWHLPAASQPLRGSHAAVAGRVDARIHVRARA
jgi:hypothetical protein